MKYFDLEVEKLIKDNYDFLVKPFDGDYITTIVELMESTILKNMKFFDCGERVLMCGLDGDIFELSEDDTNYDVIMMCGEDYINGLWCVEDFMDYYDEFENDEELLNVYKDWIESERNVLGVEMVRFSEMFVIEKFKNRNR